MTDTATTPPATQVGGAALAAEAPEKRRRDGLICAVSAFGLWGISPAYWKLLGHVAPLEILGHRILWALVFVVALMTRQGNMGRVFGLMRQRKVFWGLAISTVLVSANWFLFLWAVTNERVLEASLGYYINPLFSVALGFIALGERLSRAQTIAVGLATMGVAILTVSIGALPWVSLTLAGTFAIYGLIRKMMPVTALEGHFVETLACAPFALAYLIWLGMKGELAFGSDLGTDVMLILAGPWTAVPLMLFAAAAQRLQLSTLGLTQYIAPTLHFLLGVFIFQEAFTLAHGITFALIWCGLVLYSSDSYRRERRLRRGA